MSSKLIISHFLSTLEQRKRVLDIETQFHTLLITIDFRSPSESHQAALRVPEPILKSKMFKKI